ncbi:MAG: histidine kinase N-terminal 7TM domain-containing protein, partial [Atribacterota bacterium]|nr:histidine kinase N-terminal 7TM domain-containing protein [Atribacterota bacterium]
ILQTTGIIVFTFGLIIWNRKSLLSRNLALLAFALALWSITDSFLYVSPSLKYKIYWAAIGYPGSQFSPVLLFFFFFNFTGLEKLLTRKRMILLCILPVISVAMAATNSWHHWLWASLKETEGWFGSGTLFVHGPWFWVEVIYSYTLIGVGVFLYLRFLIKSSKEFSLKARQILTLSIFPFFGHFLYIFYPEAFSGCDLTPLIFGAVVLIFIWFSFRYQYIDLVPIARATLIDNLEVGFLFLDIFNRIVDINPKAKNFLNLTNSIIGKSAENSIPIWSKLEQISNDPIIVDLGGNKNHIYLSVYSSPVIGKNGSYIGKVMVFNEITEQLKIKEAWLKTEQEKSLILQAMSDTVAYYNSPNLTISWANPAAAISVNRKLDEISGLHCYEIWHQRSEPCEECPVLKTFTTGQKQTIEKETPDGLTFELHSYPVFGNQNKIIGVVEIGYDVTIRKNFEKRMRYFSFHDALTGLYNRAYFEEELKRLFGSREIQIGILLADVNGLKLVNDAFGHQAGDLLLKRVADILRLTCRKEDLIARWGGDEFIVLLANINIENLKELEKRIQEACLKDNNEPVPLSISVGYAIKEKRGTIEELLKITEERMYRKKLDEGPFNRQRILDYLEDILEKISRENGKQIENMNILSNAFAQELGLSEHEKKQLNLLIRFHDLGKITISQDIINKTTELTPEEWESIKKHSEIGYRIANSSPELAPIAEAILAHHERWNGQGYPQNLEGEKIPLLARILAIVEAYDVMLRGSSYKTPLTEKQACQEIQDQAGYQFDPRLVENFLKLIQQAKLKKVAE